MNMDWIERAIQNGLAKKAARQTEARPRQKKASEEATAIAERKEQERCEEQLTSHAQQVSWMLQMLIVKLGRAGIGCWLRPQDGFRHCVVHNKEIFQQLRCRSISSDGTTRYAWGYDWQFTINDTYRYKGHVWLFLGEDGEPFFVFDLNVCRNLTALAKMLEEYVAKTIEES